ncbi:type VI secretion system Vgr family protein [Candidatus Manganitrophus noduliformans]|uniref:Type VI secretion system tip protein VgrG n=1 Tax=Candidatus Manganitrophus noduliformans TaxID=2606439 RepID=A0A7X6IC34_9BACT|nr:type VI secretion system tip protein TssI/VgrG [Candidatus Manganitrophus noduliformans]NKE72401.1 type VI secretion system tip protein VgrG [Candidatus Manganitrophus noduliformans]
MAIIRAKNETDYALKIDGQAADLLKVVRFSGTEAVSELFHFSVDLASKNQGIDFSAVLGKPATLTLRGPGGKRVVHGLVHSFEQTGNIAAWACYRAGIVPTVWPLSRLADCRIFQNLSIPDIIKKVLTDRGISSDQFRFSLKKSYKPRDYCVQYRESDLSFITRLAEQYGLFYFFEHTAEKDVMVIGDDSVAHVPVEGKKALLYSTGGSPEEESVTEFRLNQGIRSGAVSLRDYDFKKPGLNLEQKAKAEGDGKLEVYDYPGEYVAPDEGKDLAKVRLEAFQATRQVGSGQSDCRRFVPGYLFALNRHPRSSFNQDYLLVRLSQTGSQPQVLGADTGGGGGELAYQNDFECIPSGIPYRPPLTTPRPSIQSVQTAVVVGPAGEEIYTDAHGRVKVQFHWDRQGKKDEKSSCWLRVAQIWAGPGWGSMFIPRIGQEVVVSFLEGDPDQPIIIGAVYNGMNVPPYALPGEKTKSAIKTNSSPGGEGSNEIRFEDAKGSEEIYLHGQKDWTIGIENDKNQKIGHDETLEVGNDRSKKVIKNETEDVGENKSITVGKDHNESIGKNAGVSVGENASLSVGKDHTIDVGKNQSVTIGENQTLSVGKNLSETIGEGANVSIGKDLSASVGKNLNLDVGESASVKTGKKGTVDIGDALSVDVAKKLDIHAGDAIKIVSDKEIVLTAGSASITLKKNGDITIKGNKINIKGDGDIVIKGSKVQQN